ncbi:MAG: hypothetical protein AAB691_01495 [Patescibacteria group bacterium]
MRAFPGKEKEFDIFKHIRTPSQTQDFLNTLAVNFEESGETSQSPLSVLKSGKAHCFEGATLAAAIFWYHGRRPLLLNLRTTNADIDHTVALFKESDRWGAVSKTNHAVLRYREPVYKTIRELVLSYFHEYFLDNGGKTLRKYSPPFSLLGYEDDWLTTEKNLWGVSDDISASRHIPILRKSQTKNLRLADRVEIEAGKLVERTRTKNTRENF